MMGFVKQANFNKSYYVCTFYLTCHQTVKTKNKTKKKSKILVMPFQIETRKMTTRKSLLLKTLCRT